jgi:hypothetical protein
MAATMQKGVIVTDSSHNKMRMMCVHEILNSQKWLLQVIHACCEVNVFIFFSRGSSKVVAINMS